MICMAYLSSASASPENTELDRILIASERNNRSRSVTGMLCHHDGSFLQFLEGEAVDVDAIFSVISNDTRHRGLVSLYRQEIADRLFPDWSMALARQDEVDPKQRAFCKGLRDLETATTAAHRELVEPFVKSFSAWMR